MGDHNANCCLAGRLLDGAEEHVELGPQHEEHTARVQVGQKGQIDIGAVAQQHIAGVQARTQRRGAHRIVVRGILDDGEGRQEGADVQPKMTLGGRLSAAMPSPVNARQRQT